MSISVNFFIRLSSSNHNISAEFAKTPSRMADKQTNFSDYTEPVCSPSIANVMYRRHLISSVS